MNLPVASQTYLTLASSWEQGREEYTRRDVMLMVVSIAHKKSCYRKSEDTRSSSISELKSYRMIKKVGVDIWHINIAAQCSWPYKAIVTMAHVLHSTEKPHLDEVLTGSMGARSFGNCSTRPRRWVGPLRPCTGPCYLDQASWSRATVIISTPNNGTPLRIVRLSTKPCVFVQEPTVCIVNRGDITQQCAFVKETRSCGGEDNMWMPSVSGHTWVMTT